VHCPCPEPNPKGTARFTKAARLRHRQDFLRAQAQGKRLHTRHFGVTLAPMAEGHPRLGLVATRRLGKAVQRNRVKRLLREFFRRHQTGLPAFDLVIMAKKGASTLEYHQVEEELGRLLFSRARQKTHD
jgi:ribonuclease P protein component